MAKSRSSKRAAPRSGRRRRLTRKELQAFLAKDAELMAQIRATTKVQELLRVAGDKTRPIADRVRALHEADKIGTGLDLVKKLLAMLGAAGSVH